MCELEKIGPGRKSDIGAVGIGGGGDGVICVLSSCRIDGEGDRGVFSVGGESERFLGRVWCQESGPSVI